MKSRTVHGWCNILVWIETACVEMNQRTGQVPLLRMLSKDRASGMPAVLPELPEVYDSGLSWPLMEAAEEVLT
jgi:hypothetical protein